MDPLQRVREAYAEEIRGLAGVENEALVRAFARVRREAFLGPGPWRVQVAVGSYAATPDADPRHLYRNVLVAIDEARSLNNGEPAGLARWFEALELGEGARVLHLGAGVGYYTAILAETVGPRGHVAAVERDPALAARAAANLAGYDHVEVVATDGSAYASGPRDAIFVNAGATAPRAIWLDALAAGGRLVLPLTVDAPGIAAGGDGIGVGYAWKFRRPRGGPRWPATVVSPVGVYHCVGAREPDEERALRAAYDSGAHEAVRWLRRDAHEERAECWLHAPELCLSR